MRVFSILYYTNDYGKYDSFRNYCIKLLSDAFNAGTQVRILDSFVKIEKNFHPKFTCLRDLTNYLEEYEGNLSDLIVVMDCASLPKEEKKSLRVLLIEYLEIKFLFDSDPRWIIFHKEEIKNTIWNQNIELCESCLNELENCTEKGKVIQSFKDKISADSSDSDYWKFLKKIFKNHNNYEERVREIRKQLISRIAFEYVKFDFLMLPEKNDDFILNIVHTRDNLFDASNIRYAIKQWKYAELDVHSRNFLLIQHSRRDNLAICVEEERDQNRFNSYCLFASGYSVLPVTSATELKIINKKAEELKPSLVIRDYDLQFFDSSSVQYGPDNDSNGSIKAIRGFRDDFEGNWTTHVYDSPCWSSFYLNYYEKNIITFPRHFSNKFDCLAKLPKISRVSISNRKINCPVYYVSKGAKHVKVLTPARFFSTYKTKKRKYQIRISYYYANGKDGNKILYIPGITKPVSGIYEPFMCIPEIRKRIKAIKAPITDYINTSREGHAHGTSLDIYATVISLIQRAEHYYNNGKYIHAAILSNEAIEYLNGFHEALLLKAYQILTVSENAIAMDTVGGNENALKEDSLFRINKIEDEIEKILRRKKEGDNSNEDRREFKYNVLNQIFSACRKFCKEKEHFFSEDSFISAMAHTNEGFTPGDISNELLTIYKRIQRSWATNKNNYKFDSYDK